MKISRYKISLFVCLLTLLPSLMLADTTSPKPILNPWAYSQPDIVEMQKNKSINEIVDAAVNMDPTALFLVATYYYGGYGGLKVDIEEAMQFFSFSASLGYVPAMVPAKHPICLAK